MPGLRLIPKPDWRPRRPHWCAETRHRPSRGGRRPSASSISQNCPGRWVRKNCSARRLNCQRMSHTGCTSCHGFAGRLPERLTDSASSPTSCCRRAGFPASAGCRRTGFSRTKIRSSLREHVEPARGRRADVKHRRMFWSHALSAGQGSLAINRSRRLAPPWPRIEPRPWASRPARAQARRSRTRSPASFAVEAAAIMTSTSGLCRWRPGHNHREIEIPRPGAKRNRTDSPRLRPRLRSSSSLSVCLGSAGFFVMTMLVGSAAAAASVRRPSFSAARVLRGTHGLDIRDVAGPVTASRGNGSMV